MRMLQSFYEPLNKCTTMYQKTKKGECKLERCETHVVDRVEGRNGNGKEILVTRVGDCKGKALLLPFVVAFELHLCRIISVQRIIKTLS